MKLPSIHSTPHTDVSILSQMIHLRHLDARKHETIFRQLAYPFDAEHLEMQHVLMRSFTSSDAHQEQKKHLQQTLNAWHKNYGSADDYLTFKIGKSRTLRIRKTTRVLFGPMQPVPSDFKLTNSSLARKKALQKKKNTTLFA